MRAIEDCDAVIRLNPGAFHAFYFRGAAYDRIEMYDRAIAAFDAALALDPKHAYSLWGRGHALAKSGDRQRAEQEFAAARAIAPDIDTERAEIGLKR